MEATNTPRLPRCKTGTIHSTMTTVMLCDAGNAMLVCRAKAEAILADPNTTAADARLVEANRSRWGMYEPIPGGTR